MKLKRIRLDHFLLVVLLSMGATSCGALPRIVILHDALSAEEHLQLGMAYESQGQWDLALSEYDAALNKGGSLPQIKGNIGNIHYRKKEYIAAEAAYRSALRSQPRNAPILNNLANLYLVQQKNLKEAEDLVRKAIELDRSRRAAYLDTLGSIYLARGQYAAALSSYEEAEGLAPRDARLRSQLREHKKRTEALRMRAQKTEGNSGAR